MGRRCFTRNGYIGQLKQFQEKLAILLNYFFVMTVTIIHLVPSFANARFKNQMFFCHFFCIYLSLFHAFSTNLFNYLLSVLSLICSAVYFLHQVQFNLPTKDWFNEGGSNVIEHDADDDKEILTLQKWFVFTLYKKDQA